MRITLTFLLCCFCHAILSQEAVTISGTVYSNKYKTPVAGATLIIQPESTGKISDSNGYYKLTTDKSREKIDLIVGAIGFVDQEISINVDRKQKAIQLDIYLEEIDFGPPALVYKPVFREVTIEGTLANRSTPVAYSELNAREISKLNNGQDLPYILKLTPSLVSTSDAGNGIGYTGLWIRGSDQTRINVTINGIPLNDPESQQVFWVNTPDFASSANNIQIQRGIGTSTNGTGSFGGSIKLETRGVNTIPYASTNNCFGSFNTRKSNLSFGTGLINERFILEGRLSQIKSDGYLDRASSDLKSFFLEGTLLENRTSVKLTAFGGAETTYQSWAGTPVSLLSENRDSIIDFAVRNGYTVSQTDNLLNSGRTYNFYEYQNQVDNYKQNHIQLNINHEMGPFQINTSGHYTHGEGYFEESKEDQNYEDYGLIALQPDSNFVISSTDLIRRRWLKNDFYGILSTLKYKSKQVESSFGVSYNEYNGNHFGEVLWMEFAGNYPANLEYYRGESFKSDGNVYLKNVITLRERFFIYADWQLRQVLYRTEGLDNDLRSYDIDETLVFSNPKAGITARISENERMYASAAYAGKEPNRNDFIDAIDPTMVKPEYMTDIEAGYQFENKMLAFGLNGYYMKYDNQLVLTGELNDVGAALRTNVPRSFRRGIEFEARLNELAGFAIGFNATISQNKIEAFKETIYDYTTDFDVISIEHRNTDISFSPRFISGSAISYTLRKMDSSDYLEFAWMLKQVGKQYLDNTQNELLTIDPYFTNDLRISGNKTFENKLELNVQIWVNNLFNFEYSANGYTYSYFYERRITERFYYPQAGRNYMLGIGLKF